MLSTFLALEIEPLRAQKLFNIGPLAITNAMFFAVITGLFTIGVLLAAARYSQLHPRSRLAYTIELLVDYIWDAAIGVFGDKKTALKHLHLQIVRCRNSTVFFS